MAKSTPETRRVKAIQKSHYAGGVRVMVGGVPCKMATKPRRGHKPHNAFTPYSTGHVWTRQTAFAREELAKLGIAPDPKQNVVQQWIDAYKAHRQDRGDAIPEFPDNSMDVDMFTGEVTVPAGFETPADVPETPEETAEIVCETPALDMERRHTVRPATAAKRIVKPLDMTRYHGTRRATWIKRKTRFYDLIAIAA